MSNHATKPDLKSRPSMNTLQFAKKADLAGLKSGVKNLDIDILQTTPVDLSKQSNVVK